MNTIDPYATLRAAFHAGATIQAYTTYADDGHLPIHDEAVRGYGIWRDLSCDGEPKFSCHPTRYRVKPDAHWTPDEILEATAALRNGGAP